MENIKYCESPSRAGGLLIRNNVEKEMALTSPHPTLSLWRGLKNRILLRFYTLSS
jgi:hypothetical protein